MRTATKSSTVIAVLLFGLLAGFHAAGQVDKQGEALLQAAKNTELVKGDLKAAIEQYKKILVRSNVGRTVAAKALLEMGQCYEKLGQAEARNAYEQLVKQYADQTEQAQAARARLAALAGTPSRTAGTDMTIRRIWSDRFADDSGAISPDGRYLSFVDSDPGTPRIDLTIREIVSGQKRRLTSKEYVLGSIWSPDGGRIAYFDWMREPQLRIIGRDGSGAVALALGEPLDWSPDGRLILAIDYRNYTGSSEKLALISVADGSFAVLGTTEKPIPSQSARFSADGKYIVYDLEQQEGSSERDIFIIPIDGKQGMPLVRHPANDWLLGWVPGSDILLFASDRSGTQDAWALHVADGKPRGEPVLIRKEIGPISPMGFTREGTFCYSHRVSIMDVYESSLDLAKGMVAEPPKKIIRPVEGINSNAEWSPDGKYLAYVSERKPANPAENSSYVVCIRSEQTGEVREATPPIKSPFFNIHWSADGKAVFAAMEDKTARGLFKIDIQTGKHALVVRPDHFTNLFRSFSVSPDGRSVYYLNDRPKEYVAVIRHDLETGQEKEVYRGGRLGPGSITLSPDGKYLAIGMRIMPTGGGEIRDLLQGKPGESVGFGAWTPDGKSILFFKGTTGTRSETRELWQADLAGGEPRKINIGMDLRQMHLHPDGRRIAFTTRQTITEIWVMENFLPALKAVK